MAKKTKAASKTKPAAAKAATSKTPAAPAAKGAKAPAPKAAKPATVKPAAVKPATVKPAKAAAKRAEPTVAAVESVPIAVAAAAKNESLEQRFASFEDAQSAAIDQLLHAIEEAEARLLAAKRATSFAQLEQLSNGRS